jgi:hypothetical protein
MASVRMKGDAGQRSLTRLARIRGLATLSRKGRGYRRARLKRRAKHRLRR